MTRSDRSPEGDAGRCPHPSPPRRWKFTLAADALFGVPVGLLVVLAGATGGAVVAFHLARGLGREGEPLAARRLGLVGERQRSPIGGSLADVDIRDTSRIYSFDGEALG